MRGRLLILIGLIILLVAIVVVVVILPGQNANTPPADTTGDGGGVDISPDATVAPTPTPVPVVPIVVALQNLPRGYRFPDTIEELQNVVGFANWPDFAVPFNAIQQIAEDPNKVLREQILGQIVRTDISREQPILTTLLVEDLVNAANVGSDAAAVLPTDRVAVTIPVNRVTSVGYAIQDGDYVDVIISMLFVDVDEIFQSIQPNNITLFNVKENGDIEFVEGIAGRPDITSLGPAIIGPSERQRPRLVTQRTIQGALVLHVGDFPLDGKFIGIPPTPTPVPVEAESDNPNTPPPPPTPIPPPDIVTLGVTPQYAVFLVWAIEAKLPLTLALRSATDTSRNPTEPVTLEYIMNEFRINLPGRRDFTIEPAIRSIRQLLAGDEISLNPSP
jgi:Flp pilus assembly protein CpaB